MTISKEYTSYLQKFGKTCTTRELWKSNDEDLVALRHDVDYDIDVAMEMAFWEYREGKRATYFLLDTAEYWEDPRLIAKCLQLQDFGHEIGLHLNVLAKWHRGDIDDVGQDIARSLARLRDGGVSVSGIAAHGDRQCYLGNFINYWCFRDLRPADPAKTETGLSAEGVPAETPQHSIHYPDDHALQREDGAKLSLWSLSMSDFGLDYDAAHLFQDGYFSDSGGWWYRTPDPKSADLTKGRHQILIHPIHWRGAQRKTFILSTARSGSLWLSQFLEQATSCRGVHEFSLNHSYRKDKLEAEKRTFGDLSALLRNRQEAQDLMIQSRDYMETHASDWAECNVYLAHFLPELQATFPDAQFVHLHRNPQDVVRSIMNRDWYDTPDDVLHPPVNTPDWDNLEQFEKACWYARKVNEDLIQFCPNALSFESMTSDPSYLEKELPRLGIAVFPRLAADLLKTPLNRNRSYDFPKADDWTAEDKSTFAQICGSVTQALGYPLKTGDKASPYRIARRPKPSRLQSRRILNLKTLGFFQRIWRIFLGAPKAASLHAGQCKLAFLPNGAVEISLPPGKNAHLLLQGGSWRELKEGSGHKVTPGTWYSGTLDINLPEGMNASAFCLHYDAEGKLLDRKLISPLRSRKRGYILSFRPRPMAAAFNIALYFPSRPEGGQVIITEISLSEVWSERDEDASLGRSSASKK